LESSAIIVGSSTINNDMLNPVSSLLEEMRALKPAGKLGAAFGSHGWRGGAVEGIEKFLAEAGIKQEGESLKLQWAPDEDYLAQCRDWGKQFAAKLQ